MKIMLLFRIWALPIVIESHSNLFHLFIYKKTQVKNQNNFHHIAVHTFRFYRPLWQLQDLPGTFQNALIPPPLAGSTLPAPPIAPAWYQTVQAGKVPDSPGISRKSDPLIFRNIKWRGNLGNALLLRFHTITF